MKLANVLPPDCPRLTRKPRREPNAELVQMLTASGLKHRIAGSGEVRIELGNTELSFDEDGKLSCVVASDAEAA